MAWVFHVRTAHEKLNFQLVGAVLDGDPQAVRDFLKQGADANARLPARSRRRGYTEYGKQLLRLGPRREGSGISALMTAALIRDLPIMKILLAAGANPSARDEDGYTPILFAAERQKPGSTPALRLLIENGADIKAKANNGATAWRLATKDPEALRVLNAAASRHTR